MQSSRSFGCVPGISGVSGSPDQFVEQMVYDLGNRALSTVTAEHQVEWGGGGGKSVFLWASKIDVTSCQLSVTRSLLHYLTDQICVSLRPRGTTTISSLITSFSKSIVALGAILQ